MAPSLRHVLLITESPDETGYLIEFLQDSSEGTIKYESCKKFAGLGKQIQKKAYDVLMLDQSVPGGQNVDFVRRLVEAAKNIPVIVINGSFDEAYSSQVLDSGAEACLTLGKDDGRVITQAIINAARHRNMKSNMNSSTQFLSAIMKASSDAIVLTDDAGTIVSWNESAQRLFGYESAEIIGKHSATLLVKEERKAHLARLKEKRKKQAETREVVVKTFGQRKDNSQVPIEHTYGTLDTDNGRYHLGVFRDLSDTQFVKELKRTSKVIFESVCEGIMITDTKNNVIAVNPGFSEITGYSSDDVIGKKSSILNSGRHDNAFFNKMWTTLCETGCWQGEIWNRRKDGEVYPEWLSINAIKDEHGTVVQFIGVFSDITKRKEDEQTIQNLSNFDSLTGLPNRTLLHDRMHQAARKADRENGKIASLSVDLDWFSWINETLGVIVGDRVLETVAARLATCIDAEDTIARSIGDQFVIIMSNVHSVNDVVGVAHSILKNMSLPIHAGEIETFVTGSMGVSIYPDDDGNIENLLNNAQTALTKSKELGRNTFQFFKPEMNEQGQQQALLERGLRKALDREEMTLFYQPQFDLKTNKIIGAEALMRWNHPDIGNVSPAVFIPLAEKWGMIKQLGKWALEQACRQRKIWKEDGLPNCRVAINVSAYQFDDDSFIPTLKQVLKQTGLKAHDIELEITESLLMENSAKTANMLESLTRMGVPLSLDDFGTGYSSLAYLKHLPIDSLKVDRSFIENITHDKKDQAIVSAIVDMSGAMGYKVVCEGIENKEQMDFLASVNCDIVQGYFTGRPVPAEEFTEMYSKHESFKPVHAPQNYHLPTSKTAEC